MQDISADIARSMIELVCERYVGILHSGVYVNNVSIQSHLSTRASGFVKTRLQKS